MSSTAVVILNYNGEKLLRQFLPSVIRYSENAELVVADNGSTDNSVGVLETEFPQVRIIRLEKNYGFCGGYNRALKEVPATYFVLLNSDVEVTDGWLKPLTRLLDNNSTIGAVQPKILSYRQPDQFEYAGAAGGFIDVLGYPFCRGRIFNYVEKDNGQYDDTREIFWATGACIMIRSDLYHEFGGLDEDFFAHMEEIDLCWKLHRMGNRIFYCGDSYVYHLGAGTLEYASPRKTYYNFRNGLSLIYKHFNSAELVWKLPLRVVLDWLACFLFLLKGQLPNALAVGKAHFHFIKNIQRDRQKRRDIKTAYPVYSRAGIYQSLIVVDYYIKGRKKLSGF